MRRSSKRASEGSREVADGKPALAGQICEPDLPVQVFLQKLSHSTLLPRYESTATCLRCNERRSIPLRYMSAKQKTEVIEKELLKLQCSG